jgi:hypothetical protein
MKRSQDALCNMDFAEWIADSGKEFIAPITTASA